MAYEDCKSCNGLGSVASHLNPYGHKYSAGIGRDVCRSCNGKGKIRVPDSSPAKPPTVNTEFSLHVWVFGLITAFFFAMLQPWGLWWPLAGGLGFAIGGVGAGFLGSFKIGRYILIGLTVALVLFVVVGFFAASRGS